MERAVDRFSQLGTLLERMINVSSDFRSQPTPDFWETASLSAKSYALIQKQFSWDLPTHFNIGVDASDKHAHTRDRVALVYDKGDGSHEDWTFGKLMLESNRLANALRGLGITQGDRVAVLLSQSPALVTAHLAVYKLGAIVVPLFSLFGSDALLYRLNDSAARIIVTDARHGEILLDHRPDLPDLEHVVVTDTPLPGSQFWDTLVQQGSAKFLPVTTRADDPAIIIYTSGTTGPAKGALHAHRVLLGHLPGVSISHDLLPQPGDFLWTPADWAWIGGMFDVLFPALHWGVPILAHRMGKFDPDEAYGLMSRWHVTNAFLPPTALRIMRQVPNPQRKWPLALRSVASGGEPLGTETRQWALDALGVHINEFYGQTECNMVLSNAHTLYPAKPNSMGLRTPGHQVAIIDSQGGIVPHGTIGEVAVASPDPVMFLEYWHRPEATREKYLGLWLRTGDMGFQDDDGYFSFVGRDDDIIMSAGYRIGPAEIEEVLIQHPAVQMAAVVGIPDPLRGQAVKAFIQLGDPDDASDHLARQLQEWVKIRLAAHEYPRSVEFVAKFPMTPSGKIQRRLLRDNHPPNPDRSNSAP